MVNITTSNYLALSVINNVFDKYQNAKVILLSEIPSDAKRNLNTFTEYDTGSSVDIKQFELPNENGYVSGGQLINNISIKDDDGYYLTSDDMIFINNDFDFKIYGLSIISGNDTLVSFYFDNVINVKNSDLKLEMPQSSTGFNKLFFLGL